MVNLEGQCVKEAKIIFDYLWLQTDDYYINLNNPTEIRNNGKVVTLSESVVLGLKDKVMDKVTITDEYPY
jgi:hypothetical protein